MTIAVDLGRKAKNDHVKSKYVTEEGRKRMKITVLNIIQHNKPVI